MQSQFSYSSLKLLFYQYRDTAYYPIVNIVILCIISIFLLFQVVIPQFSEWFSVRREVDVLRQNIKTIQENTSLLSSMDQTTLEADVQTVTAAYPFEKDYSGIITALTQTASRTNLALPDYSLSLGDTGAIPPGAGAKYELKLTFIATLADIQRFVAELAQTLPISSVSSVVNDANSASVVVEFYYRGFPSIIIDQKKKLSPLSASERALLSQLRSWQVTTQETEADIPQGTTSGAFPPPL